MKKKIRKAFDSIPHISKEETLSRLGVTPCEKRKPRFRPRRLAVAAVCLVLLGTLGTALTLAASEGGLFSFFLPEETSSETPSLTEESETPYFEGRVILSSTGWFEEAGNLVTGEFESLESAFAAVREGLPTELPLYHPTWDGDGKGTYGTGSLIVLLNSRIIVDPATMEERHYPCLQINYQTREVVTLQIHIGRRLGVPEGSFEVFDTAAGRFYLQKWVNPMTGEITYFATADLEGCGYEIHAHSPESAQRMAESLVKPNN